MEKINLIPYNVGVSLIGLPIYVTHYLTPIKIVASKTIMPVSKTKKNSKYYRTQNK